MDSMSLRILNQRPLIERTVRNMAHRYSTLSRSEVEAQCWESMWRVLQKKDGGNPRDIEGLYYFQCRSDLKGLVKWYSHRNKYVVATETQPDVVTDDDPLHYLTAQDALEATTRPLGGLLQEVMTGLGVKEAWAKQKVRKAKAALGLNADKGTRYTEEQKARILTFLGIPIGSPFDSSIGLTAHGYKPPCPQFGGLVAASYLIHYPANGQPSNSPRSNR